ncbi:MULTISPECIES: GyrI-like domain-containing protein [unclassified Enterococcus]|uniref:GyrI-like domain-containing protein n=1 Tax=unclassified Enterococcus TaxID=2608891 RepID=UPI001CE0C754|nr:MULTISPECIES: GyrI-like domain-containing protein [unclassified Enterococcus]MCA5012009.1 GyrI-like domain-containing protein [Enterococcus sp. S23]MCA5015260.1 GyrI-like domain-containing protein [Enterococcus sp. S22(2020)]
MDYHIQQKPKFNLVGYQKTLGMIDHFEDYQGISAFWADLTEAKINQLLSETKEKTGGFYGVSDSNRQVAETFDYMISVSAQGEKEIAEELTSIQVVETSWAVFTCQGAIANAVSTFDANKPNHLMQLKNQLTAPWIAESLEENQQLPRIEYYPIGDMMSDEYRCELWIPLKK